MCTRDAFRSLPRVLVSRCARMYPVEKAKQRLALAWVGAAYRNVCAYTTGLYLL